MWIHSSPHRFRAGDVVLPRSTTGVASAGYPYDAEHAEQLGRVRRDRVYIIYSDDPSDVTTLPEVLRRRDRFIYDVQPVGALLPDPEASWAEMGSRTCARAVVLDVLREPLNGLDI